MPGSYCHITVYSDPKEWPKFDAGYNMQFVETIKKIPCYCRAYNPQDRTWTIEPIYFDMLKISALELFDMVIEVNVDQAFILKESGQKVG